MKALIFEGKVVGVHEVEFPVVKEMQWVDMAEGKSQPKKGWAFKDGIFTPPPLPSPPPPPDIGDGKKTGYLTVSNKSKTITKKVYLDDTGTGLIIEK